MGVLVVGSVAYDSVKTPFGEVDQALGGSAVFFSVSASFFSKVHLVACVGKDFRPEDRFLLESRDVDLTGLEYIEGETFRWKGQYTGDLNEAETLETHLNVFAGFQPKIPEKYSELDYVFLGNIDPALQRQVVSQVKKPRLVACDTMNYWIEGSFQSLMETLKKVHILIINDTETRKLAQETNLVKAARKILGWGPRVIVVKRGEYGVTKFSLTPGGELSVFGIPAYPVEEVFDPTGAGDTFAGGFMGYLAKCKVLNEDNFRRALVYGSIMATFAVENFSLRRLGYISKNDIRSRFREFKKQMRF